MVSVPRKVSEPTGQAGKGATANRRRGMIRRAGARTLASRSFTRNACQGFRDGLHDTRVGASSQRLDGLRPPGRCPFAASHTARPTWPAARGGALCCVCSLSSSLTSRSMDDPCRTISGPEEATRWCLDWPNAVIAPGPAKPNSDRLRFHAKGGGEIIGRQGGTLILHRAIRLWLRRDTAYSVTFTCWAKFVNLL
jgi:hypothetical protein